MRAFNESISLDTKPVSIVGARLTATMAVIRMADDSLLLYSPLDLTPERRQAVTNIGVVKHLYAPNTFHHMWLGEWTTAFPEARVHAPGGLAKKRPDLTIDRIHGAKPNPEWSNVIDEVEIKGFRLEESALIHKPTKTLLVADLVHNVGQPAQTWAALYTKMMGFHDRVALSRALQWTAFSDREAARRSIDELLARDFDALVVGHGEPLPSGAQAALAEAYAWLPAVT